MRNIKSIKITEENKENKIAKIAAFAIAWGIIIPLIASGVIATWNLLLGLLGVI